ncbi:SGNH/GDSL hydrolase family protein [Pseudosporangium ferrugineum]|uniref:Lysophospholipase L1-like esterase n=1 Tax=Pseudosporangium ferrugineum TaxID=439699 RepID=A0A2T0SIJ4_9ACTN|nr:SGNH/GDSL hydrolase family protein [Pseudosporangium ferrugineum]PRY33246.1 lysophospholipase L1-like esterase [Pseudosporangium ferrugineum]
MSAPVTGGRHSRRTILALAAGAAGAAGVAATPGAADAHETPGEGWTGSWAAVPTTVPPGDPTVLSARTVRHVVHLSLGGDRLRVRLTNEFGTAPLVVGEVRVARRLGSGAATTTVPGTDRRVTFGGRGAVTVPAGAPMVSDPVALRVPDGSDLTVSIYLPGPTPVTTLAAFAFQENVVADGNVTAAARLTPVATVTQNLFLSGVSVRRHAPAIVAFGDSITNGANTRTNANHRWPDLLAARLRGAGLDRGVVNLGVSGNRLLHDPDPPAGSDAVAYAAYFGQSGLRRFDRDVLAQPGARHLIVLLGINDLGHPGTTAPASETVTAADLIGGHRQLIARARQAGMRVHGGTILPCQGDTFGFFSPENERKRREVNRWIREGGEYDGIADFDAVMRDPAQPLRLNPAYDSGDHLHPNDTGMAVMAAAVPLRFFRGHAS